MRANDAKGLARNVRGFKSQGPPVIGTEKQRGNRVQTHAPASGRDQYKRWPCHYKSHDLGQVLQPWPYALVSSSIK